MTDVMMTFPDPVSDARGTFHARAMAGESGDGSWEGWLEFLPVDTGASLGYATPVETHQHDRVTMERWASGLTRVYLEGALSRARTPLSVNPNAELLLALEEIVEALDRRLPHVERAGEAQIATDAAQLRTRAIQRIALLRRQT